MARVLGEAARYVTGQSLKKYKRQFIAIFLASFFLALVIGIWLGLSFNKHSYVWTAISIFIIALIFVLTIRFADSVSDKLEKERIKFRKGATGEALVGYILEGLPEDYVVIHGLKPKPQYGDLDHIVVGPSGIYAIDTKNWRGVVEADSKGELLVNGQPSSKADAQKLFDLTMFIKNKVKTLAGLDLFIHAILVFPRAWVKAKKVVQGYVECKTDEELANYIIKNKKEKKLTKNAIDAVLRAICKGTEMDKYLAPESK